MHELSIAISLVDIACEELARLGAVRVEALHVRVGALSGVVADALRFSFEAATAGTPLEGARLAIEDVVPAVWCARCSAERPLASAAHRRCSACGAIAPDLIRGTELELVGLEVVDP